jgi:hypothetical protein
MWEYVRYVAHAQLRNLPHKVPQAANQCFSHKADVLLDARVQIRISRLQFVKIIVVHIAEL